MTERHSIHYEAQTPDLESLIETNQNAIEQAQEQARRRVEEEKAAQLAAEQAREAAKQAVIADHQDKLLKGWVGDTETSGKSVRQLRMTGKAVKSFQEYLDQRPVNDTEAFVNTINSDLNRAAEQQQKHQESQPSSRMELMLAYARASKAQKEGDLNPAQVFFDRLTELTQADPASALVYRRMLALVDQRIEREGDVDKTINYYSDKVNELRAKELIRRLEATEDEDQPKDSSDDQEAAHMADEARAEIDRQHDVPQEPEAESVLADEARELIEEARRAAHETQENDSEDDMVADEVESEPEASERSSVESGEEQYDDSSATKRSRLQRLKEKVAGHAGDGNKKFGRSFHPFGDKRYRVTRAYRRAQKKEDERISKSRASKSSASDKTKSSIDAHMNRADWSHVEARARAEAANGARPVATRTHTAPERAPTRILPAMPEQIEDEYTSRKDGADKKGRTIANKTRRQKRGDRRSRSSQASTGMLSELFDTSAERQ